MQFRRWLVGLSGVAAVGALMSACGDAPSCGDACRSCSATCCDGYTPEIPGGLRLSSTTCLVDAKAECESHGGVHAVSFDDIEIPVDEGACCQTAGCSSCAAACCDGTVPVVEATPFTAACAAKANSACADTGGAFQSYFSHLPTMIEPTSCSPPAMTCVTACCDGTVRSSTWSTPTLCVLFGGGSCGDQGPFEAFYEGARVFQTQTSPACPSIAPCSVKCDGVEIALAALWDCTLCKNIQHPDCPAPKVTTITFNGSETCAQSPPP